MTWRATTPCSPAWPRRPARGCRPTRAGAAADRALAMLARLVAEGYRNPGAGADPDLDPLRGRPDLRPLLLDLAFPADPFARRD
jgi:hypothetical protein